MKRRDFFRVAAGGMAAATFSFETGGCAGSPPFQLWTWVHGGGDRTPEDWRTQYGRLAEAGYQGVLVSGGDTGIHASAAHAAGLEFHRWVWTLNRNGDEWVKATHPEWFTVSRDGNSSLDHPPYVDYYRWLCPTRPEVRAYLTQSILEIAQDAQVDGVHLDYVRHCDVILPRGLWSKYDLIQDREYPEFDFCYCEACREAFSSVYNTDPLKLLDPPMDDAWRRFRWDGVTRLVRDLAEAVHGVPSSPTHSSLRSAQSGKAISAAVFPTPTIARRLVRQAWDEWPVDTIFPMLYHSFYEKGLEWIGEGVREGLLALASRNDKGSDPGDAPGPQNILAGLYLPALSGEERLRAVEIAREAGAHGVSFFEMNGLEF